MNNPWTGNVLRIATILLAFLIGGNLQAQFQMQAATGGFARQLTHAQPNNFRVHILSDGHQVLYHASHPYVWQIIQGIEESIAYFSSYDPGLQALPMTYYIFDGKKYSNPETILLASEYMTPDAIFYYNPASPHLIAANQSRGGVTLGMASNGQGTSGQTPPPSSTKRLTFHEKGHVKWSKMSAFEKEVWTEVYTYTKELKLDRPTNTYTKQDGSTGNYYDDMGPEEGFCEAYADSKLGGVALDESITTYMDNLPPV